MWENTTIASLLAQAGRMQVERRPEFAALPRGWAAVGMLALVALLLAVVIVLYRHEGRVGASARVRGLLAGLRCLVIGLLAMIWLEPVLATYLHRVIDSYTIVLVDTSSSMDLADRYRDPDDIANVRAVAPDAGREPVRRGAIVERMLTRDDRAFLAELAERNRVKVFQFSDELQPLFTLRAAREDATVTTPTGTSTDDGEAVLPADELAAAPLRWPSMGPATDLGRAVRGAVESLGRAPIAGVVLLTDGGVNQGDDLARIGAYARDRRIPLHVIGIGDPSEPRNLRVAEVIAPDNVFADDPFAVVGQITGQGLAGETVTVELTERSADGDGDGVERVIASRQVALGPDDSVTAISFDHRQATVGRFSYAVRVPVDANESVADDNRKQITVNVIENTLRVLVVAGAPSWEYRYLTRLLERDRTFQLSCWLQSADIDAVRDGNVIIDHLPDEPEELFAYDAIILLDPDPLELTADWCERVGDLVTRHGGGLLFAAARKHAPAFVRDPATERVRRLLPVTFDEDAELILNQIGHYQQEAHPLIIPPAAAGHPALQLPPGRGPAFQWSALGDVYWHFPVLREKPVASVLMRHGDPRMQNTYGGHVLFATQYAGAGRTAFLGFDGTWRWRGFGADVFDRFWVQTIRYLVEGKVAGGNRRGMLLTDQDTYPLGKPIRATARLFDQQFAPLQTAEVTGYTTLAGEERPLVFTRMTDRLGWYEATFVPPRTGACALMLPLPGDRGLAEVVRREVQVVRPNLEIRDARMHRAELQALAAATPDGAYHDVRDTARVPEKIPDRHESTTIRSRPTPLWDNGWLLGVLIGLLCVEWALRKYYRLL
jgi:hypothetical protein